jgi:hypothetical protein
VAINDRIVWVVKYNGTETQFNTRAEALTHMSAVRQAKLSRAQERALTIIKAAGYRVSKLRAKTKHAQSNGKPTLNALGKPLSASYDPNYQLTHKPPRLPRRRFYPPKLRSRDIRFEQG